jgi:hypothetical protein
MVAVVVGEIVTFYEPRVTSAAERYVEPTILILIPVMVVAAMWVWHWRRQE